MVKSFTLKSEDVNIQMPIALEYYGLKKSQGTWRGFNLYLASTQGLVSNTYWYAVKDDIAYVDRGLSGLLDYIDKLTEKKE
jgi:hypothetical protein